jgi:short-subunit dehydrogenase
MPRRLDQAVVAITGASSGIGRAAALMFADRGADLVLCARAPGPLSDVARECEQRGAEVLADPLDVADEEAVEGLAARGVDRFGRLDVWVNNAGVIAYGEFAEIPSEVFRAVVETNLMGQVHGARAALRRFLPQGEGVLINMSSVWGRVSSPMVSPYVVSKNAVRALSECLRGEVADLPGVHITTLVPQAVDTPIYERGGNYSGRKLRPIPPIVSPEEVAAGIVACAEKPKREVNYGRAGRSLEILHAVAPPIYRRLAHRAFRRGTLTGVAAPATSGAVLEGTGLHAIEGGWRRDKSRILWRAFASAAAGALRGLFKGE